MKDSLIEDLKNLNHRGLWRPFMEKYDCRVICEVGVRRGRNLRLMTEHSPKIAVAVDSWIDDSVRSRNDMGDSQAKLDGQYEDVKRLAAERPCIQIYREYSTDAARRFPNNYFDLIYIDADHTYEGCLSDLETWYPKVKKGRFLIGDDYRDYVPPRADVKFGVIEAVQGFAQKEQPYNL